MRGSRWKYQSLPQSSPTDFSSVPDSFPMSSPAFGSFEAKSADESVSTPDTSETTSADGSFYQAKLGSNPKRKNVFSPLDAAYADAVQRDAELVVYSEEEEAVVRQKIDKVVLPLIVISYMCNQFDRTNIGNAHVIPSFNQNFGITTNKKWTMALGVFYIGYCILEIPANILQRRIGANKFFFLSMVFWGLASISFVYSKGYPAVIALRVLMGIGEAGYYAGMIYYLSFWYKRSEMAFRISISMSGTLPGAIGSMIAFGLIRANTSLLTGWQLLFLIEAIPTLIMAVVLLLVLPSFPFAAPFLTTRERAIAQARLNRDQKPQSHGGMTGMEGIKAVLSDVHAWLFVILYTCFNIGAATISYFLPTLIRELGFSPITSQGLVVAPYVVGWFVVVFQAWHSDRTNDRGWHIMLSCVLSVIGYTIIAVCAQKSVAASYYALFLVVAGNYSLFPLVMSWAANTLSPTSKRGVGTAFIVSISNAVSVGSPHIYFDPQDRFRKGHAIAGGLLLCGFFAAFTLRTRFAVLNKRNAAKLLAMSPEEKEVLQLNDNEEVWDNDPRYVFKT
ncbi:hypothetical protein HGRIS_012482 [Hohenbuehelia grisea]|uniref:Major facilitator superfamily (MFS) profile domain-containing protein n=1 Tax=Hohenbuehelia grisea TaxID=104357 RepID=A0ABR3ISG9_9AGAR